MGYIYDCDGCNKTEHSFPPFAGEFTEQFLKTVGGQFAAVFDPGEKVTICADCMELQVLAGKIVVCQRCGTGRVTTTRTTSVRETEGVTWTTTTTSGRRSSHTPPNPYD